MLLLTLLTVMPICGTEPIFHFRFDRTLEAGSVKDKSSRFTLVSPQKLFLFERGGLRIAEGAQFYIPASELPELKEEFTLCCWYHAGARAMDNSLFFRGMRPEKPQIHCKILNLSPAFFCESVNGTCAIHTSGYGHMILYPDKSVIVNTKAAEVQNGTWNLVTYVFGQGSMDVYVNGVHALRREISKTSTLKKCRYPLYIGADRKKDLNINVVNSNMLVNDIRLYETALSAGEIRAIFDREKAEYSRFAPLDPWGKLPPCNSYMEKLIPGYDPDYKKRLPKTEAYLRNLPKAEKRSGKTFSTIKWDKGMWRLDINHKLFAPLLYQNQVNLTIDPEYGRKFEDFAAAGFALYGGQPGSWHDFPNIWSGDGKYDFTLIDKLIRKMIELNPDAYIQIALHPEPNHWFQQAHKRELELYYAAGRSTDELKIYYTGHPGSDVWRKFASNMLEALARHVEAQDYGNRVYDYKLFMAGGGEWYWPGCFTGGVGGYSKSTRETFRKWLKEHYRTNAALQKAWNDPQVTLAAAEVPAPEFRLSSEHFNFRDPVKARPCYDFRKYMDDYTVKSVSDMTSALKRGCGGKKTVTIYYGYPLHYSASHSPTQFTSAVFTLGRVLRLDSVDNIATPITYNRRAVGLPGVTLNPFTGSGNLHRKLIWQEHDLRTHLFPSPIFGAPRNWQESCMQIRRGFALASAMQMGCWFLGLPAYCYHEEHIMDEMARLQKQAANQLKDDMSSVAEVALVYDEESMRHSGFNRNRNFLQDHVLSLYDAMHNAGAPFDSYLLSDIDNPKMPDYKLYLFVNTFELMPEKLAKIKAKVCRNNSTVCWSYAPGLISSKGFGTDTMRDLTGISFGLEMKQLPASLSFSGKAHLITKYADRKQKEYLAGPFVYVNDSAAEILGTAAGRPALAVRKFSGWTSVYTLMPFDMKLLAGLYEFAGVHRYSKSFDVFACNKSYLALHAASAGDKTFFLKAPADVVEVFSGKVMGKNVKKFTDEQVPFGATRYYKLTAPEK